MNEKHKAYIFIVAGILFIIAIPRIVQQFYGWNFLDINFFTSDEGQTARRIIWTIRAAGGLIVGYGTGLLGKMKGYVFGWSFVMGFIFNILGVVLVLMLTDKNKAKATTPQPPTQEAAS